MSEVVSKRHALSAAGRDDVLRRASPDGAAAGDAAIQLSAAGGIRARAVRADSAPQNAAAAVAFVERKFGFLLPYTPESLVVVDAIVDKIRDTGAAEQQAFGILSGLGCYVGEVLVRHAGASWRSASEMKMAASCGFAAVLAFPGMAACDPIGHVFQRFGSGSSSLARLYESTVAELR